MEYFKHYILPKIDHIITLENDSEFSWQELERLGVDPTEEIQNAIIVIANKHRKKEALIGKVFKSEAY